MSREIKRVPVEFDWPLNERWSGYVMPDSLNGERCPECDGGQTWAGWFLQNWCSRLQMMGQDVGEQSLGKPMHPWLANDPYPVGRWDYSDDRNHQYKLARPSADMADLVGGLAGGDRDRVLSRFSGSSYKLYRTIVTAAGLDESWGVCTHCRGEGVLEQYEGQFAERDAWDQTEPPEGDGYQLWESVSEGSPISPVFPDREGLIGYLMSDANSWGISRPLTRSQAEAFVGLGHSIASGVFVGGEMIPGDAAVERLGGGAA